jgi:mRNA interferase RelE/StbE
MYTLHLDKRLEKDLRSLSQEIQKRILSKLEALRQDPFAPGTTKLTDEDSYKIRIGDYRVIFDIDTKQQRVTILKVDYRSAIYKR